MYTLILPATPGSRLPGVQSASCKLEGKRVPLTVRCVVPFGTAVLQNCRTAGKNPPLRAQVVHNNKKKISKKNNYKKNRRHPLRVGLLPNGNQQPSPLSSCHLCHCATRLIAAFPFTCLRRPHFNFFSLPRPPASSPL